MKADLKGTQINLYKVAKTANREVDQTLFFPDILAEILQALQ